MDYITGEKIQDLCDLYLGNHNFFENNPFIFKQIDKHLLLNSFEKNYDNPKYIFCYTDILINNYNYLIHNLNKFKNNFILVFHNSDAEFNNDKLFNDVPKLLYVYTQNMNIVHHLVRPLPIGIANKMWKHGNLDIFNKILNDKNINKVNNIFFNFNINTNFNKRKYCYNEIIKKNIKYLDNQDYEEYLKTLKSYKFCICPEGNGLDTHRLWECLYLKVIPICINSILVTHYSKYFPIILLNDWHELSTENLNYDNLNWNNWNNLNFQYIKDMLLKQI